MDEEWQPGVNWKQQYSSLDARQALARRLATSTRVILLIRPSNKKNKQEKEKKNETKSERTQRKGNEKIRPYSRGDKSIVENRGKD